MPRDRSTPPPLDRAALERLALRYVERYATTRGRLVRYLDRKLRERGWDDANDPQPASLAERFAELGYIDDRGFAEAKAAAMQRRGLGGRRIGAALRDAGIEADDREAIDPAIEARAHDAAMAFARRRRIGPYAESAADRALRHKQLASMLRAGHPFDLSRTIVAMVPGQDDSDPPVGGG